MREQRRRGAELENIEADSADPGRSDLATLEKIELWQQ
jgi:hypothetical protein